MHRFEQQVGRENCSGERDRRDVSGRERDGERGGRPIRQIFFRFGDVIVEVVGSPDTAGHGPPSLWGMTYVVVDIDATESCLR